MTATEFDTRVADYVAKGLAADLGNESTAARVAVAQSRIGAVTKSRRTEAQGNYLYRGIEDVTNALAPILHELGLTMRVETMAHRLDIDPKDSRKRTAVVTCSYSLVGPDGDAVLLGSWVGEADDWSDKASNKSYSAARKLCLLEAFTIPTADVLDDTEAFVPPAGGPSLSETEQPKGPDGPPGDVTGPWEKVADAARAGVKRGDIERRDDGRWHRVGTPDHTVDPHAAVVARDKAALTAAANARDNASRDEEPF